MANMSLATLKQQKSWSDTVVLYNQDWVWDIHTRGQFA